VIAGRTELVSNGKTAKRRKAAAAFQLDDDPLWYKDAIVY